MKKSVTYLLVVTVIMSISLFGGNDVTAESTNSVKKEIEKLEEEKEKVQEEKESLNSEKEETEEKLEDNLNDQETVRNDIDSIDQQLATTNNEIEAKETEIVNTNEEIETLKEKIKELESEITELEERIEKRDALLRERLRAIQKNGGSIQYMEVILGSKSFGDFINRSSAVNTIMDQDKNIMEIHAADKKEMEEKKVEVEDSKEEVEAKKVALEEQKGELESLKVQLNDQMATKESLMAQLEEEQQHLEEHKMSLAEEQELKEAREEAVKIAMEQQKEKLEQLAEQEKQKQQQTNNNQSSDNNANQQVAPSGNGSFSWPVNGYITDYFGTRGGTHYGMDVGNATAKSGGDVPIYAAADGVVSRAYYSSSYGNVVFITHIFGDEQYESVYAHMKYTPLVSSFQIVSKGQQIGVMGTTGDSSGPHLHFEIHSPSWNDAKSHALDPLQLLN
ncbi:murein hydrolase activator EnvC family protein [Oceanobacillus halotolerans]|uniref:murein hydrolase activator EnvC family protein n=1 Tax=Oceanobacillus halotolerans TaxID=2663380 RepID=UPI0013D92781|nr:M23 family metallopeptidase [Oceanobacillus halotolerans]